jgi:hypothetical protein
MAKLDNNQLVTRDAIARYKRKKRAYRFPFRQKQQLKLVINLQILKSAKQTYFWKRPKNKSHCLVQLEKLLEDQAFLQSYDLVPPPSPLFSRQVARPATHRKTEEERQLADGREGLGEKPNHTTAKSLAH